MFQALRFLLFLPLFQLSIKSFTVLGITQGVRSHINISHHSVFLVMILILFVIVLGGNTSSIAASRQGSASRQLDTLSCWQPDLGLHNRQALILVLRNKMNVTSLNGQKNPAESNHTAIGGDAGYFAAIRKLLSYVNPLSYLGGSSNASNTAQDSRDSIWQYGPNPLPQNNQTLVRKPFQTPVTSTSNNRGRKPASSSFGSNIHTLKHDEDENQFGDRNTFWNGNSTQFGGDDNSKQDP